MIDIKQGNSIDVLKTYSDNSIDTMITDPPFGLAFMGKDWDKAVPSVEIWKECYRVLKPGSFIAVMSAPRSDVQMHMIKNISDAGFDVSFTPIYWTYATGFPKAANMGKALDKKLGVEREIISRNPNSRENCDKTNTLFESGTVGKTDFITNGSSELEGSYAGFQPKPAVEVIIIAMKPITHKTYLEQAMDNKHGITWLDDCRIPTREKLQSQGLYNSSLVSIVPPRVGGKEYPVELGRFPANLLISDDVLDDDVNRGNGYFPKKRGESEYFGLDKADSERVGKTPKVDNYSRFFSLDKWAEKNLPFIITPKAGKKEKDGGCEELPEKQFHDRGCSKNSIVEYPPDYTRKNHHPTVKPIKLMSYLITLLSRPGDIILDPFNGSGTTGCAAAILGRDYIGIELDKDFVKISKARIEYWKHFSDRG